MNRTEIAEHTFRDLSRNRNDPMTNPTTEADSQTRTKFEGEVEEVRLDRFVNEPDRYVHEIVSRSAGCSCVIVLDHPLTPGQTYEVEVTVREVE